MLSATVLFGTGIGSAYFLLLTSLQREPATVARVARLVVWADAVFTATTAVLQPLTGTWMLLRLNLPVSTPWVAWSLGLYAFAIACWLPVVVLQWHMSRLAAAAAERHRALPPAYGRLLAAWTVLGVLALVAFLAIFWLMVARTVPWVGARPLAGGGTPLAGWADAGPRALRRPFAVLQDGPPLSRRSPCPGSPRS
ncbi:hypothetical protein ISF6_5309 [Piscinibacter sakaiensis]|uniref:DUF2269 domain-containing protein n=1 Tax=Piscinibacter sakaiensis TaxID=1547922 RepID=A0A0K8P7Z9_PISS1|nr:hypothetical protein ISF6_5309 [Piscinibacter sakaiensis]